MPRFINKNVHKSYTRPRFHSFSVNNNNTADTDVKVKVENKQPKEDEKMNNIEKLKKIVGEETKIPEKKVKREKKEKGLIERTEESTLLITEDNKILLND